MKCKVCDQLLNEYEAVKRDPVSKQYLDTCTYCLNMSRSKTISKMEEEESFREENSYTEDENYDTIS